MANWFEDLTKTLADDKISRRTALQRAAGSIAGVALASLFPRVVLASGPSKKNLKCYPPGECPNGGNCSVGFTNCANNPNTNCYCFTELGGPGVCGCNTYCSQAQTCGYSTQCPKGSVCIAANGCSGCGSSSGICVPVCTGPNANCQLGSSQHAGPTAASVKKGQGPLSPVKQGIQPQFVIPVAIVGTTTIPLWVFGVVGRDAFQFTNTNNKAVLITNPNGVQTVIAAGASITLPFAVGIWKFTIIGVQSQHIQPDKKVGKMVACES